MLDKLKVFELFHNLKRLTTAGYSAKKLQDILERNLEIVSDDDLEEFAKQIVETLDDIDEASQKVREIVEKG